MMADTGAPPAMVMGRAEQGEDRSVRGQEVLQVAPGIGNFLPVNMFPLLKSCQPISQFSNKVTQSILLLPVVGLEANIWFSYT